MQPSRIDHFLDMNMSIRHITLRSLIAAGVIMITASANAQFAPRVNSEDIEGAVMPAIPFPANDRNASAATRTPQSMGLAPSTEPAEAILSLSSEDREPVKPVIRRRPFSAQEVADRLLAQ